MGDAAGGDERRGRGRSQSTTSSFRPSTTGSTGRICPSTKTGGSMSPLRVRPVNARAGRTHLLRRMWRCALPPSTNVVRTTGPSQACGRVIRTLFGRLSRSGKRRGEEREETPADYERGRRSRR
jgi:hypothetical protein